MANQIIALTSRPLKKHSTISQLERNRKHVAKMRAAGLCVICKSPHTRNTNRCLSCTKDAVARNVRIRREARSSFLCVSCREPWTGNTKTCPTCISKSRELWKRRGDSTFCTRCLMPKDGTHKACSACRKGMRSISNSRRATFSISGRCIQCGDIRTGKSLYCNRCTLRTAARRWLGDSKRWKELDTLLTKQEWKCAYTGQILILGDNASVDHKTPRSRGGENTIENVQWVSWLVNRAKTDMTHQEFLNLCYTVTNNRK